MLKSFLALSCLAVALAACENTGDGTHFNSNESDYQYSFEFNGCKTGEHQFDSLGGMCEALQSEDLNRYCARSMREDYFNKKCPGQFEASR